MSEYKNVTTIEEFEVEAKNLFPNTFKIPDDSWFHVQINSVWKHKSIQLIIFKNHSLFIEHGTTLKEIYPVLLRSLEKYFKELEQLNIAMSADYEEGKVTADEILKANQ